jgi:hypothetical protein
MLTARRAGSDPVRRQREEAAMTELDTVRGTVAEDR